VVTTGAPRVRSRDNRGPPDEVGNRCRGRDGCDHGCVHTFFPIPHVLRCQQPHECTYLLGHRRRCGRGVRPQGAGRGDHRAGQFKFWWPWQQTAQRLSQADSLGPSHGRCNKGCEAVHFIADQGPVAIQCLPGTRARAAVAEEAGAFQMRAQANPTAM
jgi:hypothetical protein